MSEQSEDAQHALIQLLSNPKIYHKLDEIADMAMRDPVKLVNDLDNSLSKSARKMALDALKDALKVGAAYVKDENEGAYKAGKFVSKYGVALLAPEEEEGVAASKEGIATGGDIKALAEDESKAAKNGSTAANRLGQKMHVSYKAGLADNVNTFKEYRLPSGKRIDFLDIKNKTIFELKSNNPRAIRGGYKQLDNYIKELRKIPEFKGIEWKKVVDKY